MLANVLIALGLGLVLFEVVEHLIFPLVWLIRDRARPRTGPLEKLVGRSARVVRWEGGQGQVFLDGELWRAVCGEGLSPGDEVFIHRVEGLLLTVAPSPPEPLPRPEKPSFFGRRRLPPRS